MRIVTHSGTFHADDVFASVILRAALGDFDFIRTRDAALIATADLVFDVGGVYAPARKRYDHHMRDLPRREDGTPYSSVGLIWRDYGRAALPRFVPGIEESMLDSVWHDVDAGIVLPIDQADNGIATASPSHLALLIEAFNPTWDSIQTYDEAFSEAAGLAHGVLQRACRQAYAEAKAASFVLTAAGAAKTPQKNPHVIVLDRKLPWEKAVFENGLTDLLFVIYPNEDSTSWYCRTIPPEPNSFGQRLSLPESWRGLQEEAFSKAAGISDGVFCHPSGFICGARSQASAIRLAEQAIAAGQAAEAI
ncbi:MYG1 family protein [Microvirga makkahensis]|uniref:MYG1 family protein n=1 Tax=Microvirga makkahensis TaxID=1128670 RepID=A0A7X3MVX9_9HYPH|nr:MYG1 family protein [Microvirga makkahensis]MXQ14169.1 MYG1 family protein [Microvirga makkahensis]